ncbi:hypothetical protein [Megalodesulfovibrio gigas]|uniref:Uncharacterized protein n=1 Tax=Megalodesulfovibrio gigas (strain ATCC 19364 / DSM 1382 / NCIMB 9332 / VKM B-1759) TaxID=1121448 RepID=T2G6V3_MEGG1|nr:hypothetical protein [Megalodesulfovibrio gigas]AGW12013.1 hypothetical protein DGI_0075 [Megalodesulfovibrio gigas DSM 1382 = ATCC 19364]
MAKREQMMLIAVGILLVGFLVYSLLGEDKPGPAEVAMTNEQLDAIKTKVMAEAQQEKFSDIELYKLEQAESPWTNSPYYDRVRDAVERQEQVKGAQLVSAESLKLHYTGFVAIDENLYAIINGLEYETGEEVADAPGVFLTNIKENEVILGQRNSTGDIVDQYLLPLAEDPLTLY